MWKTLLATFESKKFVTGFLATAALAGGHFGLHIDVSVMLIVLSPVMVAIGAQGWADSGKEAAKITAAAAGSQTSSAALQRPQAGFVALPLVIVMATALVALALHTTGCGPKTKQAEQAFINCVEDSVKAKVPSLLPTVLTILSSGVSDWQAQLEALATYAGKDALACAVQAAAIEFKSKVGAGSGSAGDGAGATRAIDFIHDHGFNYRSSPTSMLSPPRPPATNFISGTLSMADPRFEIFGTAVDGQVLELERVAPGCESRNVMPVVNCVGGDMSFDGCRWGCRARLFDSIDSIQAAAHQ